MNVTRNISKKTINLTEYGETAVPKRELSYLAQEELLAVQHELRRLVTITPDLEGKSFLFKTSSSIGVIETHGLRVQVRPRLSAREFITLIRYVLSGNIPPDHFRSHSELTWETGFEDALCMLLSDETKEILRLGLSRRYEERREPLDVLRGRPLWERNFPWQGGKAREIVCRYHKLTYNNLDNRLLLSGLKSAAVLAHSKDVRRGVFQHLKTFRELASETAPEPSQFEKVEQGYNRLSEHYRAAHGLCRILLYGLRPDSFYDDGKHLVFGLVLEMAWLFEKFVERFMAEALKPAGFTIQPQAPDREALLDAERHRYASVRPDLEVWRSEKVHGVVDAKYKRYWASGPDGFYPTRKISNEDLYQLFFYQQRLQRKYNLAYPPTAIIASPLPEEDERDGHRCVADRFKRIIWQAGSERAGDVRLLLIPVTNFLRLLEQRKKPVDIMAKIGFGDVANLFRLRGLPA